ncbi:MAG TPA: hypothetical protein VIL46_03605 [Gemmataceae bacterium]
MTSLVLGLCLSAPPAGLGQVPFPPPEAGAPLPAVPGVPLPAPRVLPAPPHPPALARIPTHREFAAAFKPAPGVYKVVVLHPRTCRPVEVCFALPFGCPKVRVGRRFIEYDYDDHEVEIRFRFNGKVDVDYD